MICFFYKVSDDGLNIQLPYRNESERYQVFYEHIKDSEIYSSEVHEYYDGIANIAVASIVAGSEIYAFYLYYDTLEMVITTGIIDYSLTINSNTPKKIYNFNFFFILLYSVVNIFNKIKYDKKSKAETFIICLYMF